VVGAFRNKSIAVVDDEPDIVQLVSVHLEKAGFQTVGFSNGNDILTFLEKKTPDLVVLDLMFPDMDGLEICRYLRSRDESASVPIIMLTARAEESDRILGLELGADDYIVKPFSPRELVARVKAVLRRHGERHEPPRAAIGGILSIDPRRYEVSVNGTRVDLTPTEFRILNILSGKKGWVFTRDQILDLLWGNEKIVLDRTVDVHIKKLREKLGEAGQFIKNVRGVGYKLDDQ